MSLAKPTLDISIEEHTNNVIKEAQDILVSLPFVLKKYKERTGKDLAKRVLSAVKYHDIGKQHHIWQKACEADNAIFKSTNNPAKMYHLRKTNFRHEIASLLYNGLNKLSDPVKVAVGAHHGKLAESESHRWENERQQGKDLWRHFKGLKNQIVFSTENDEEKFKKAVALRYEYAGPRSLLQLADHRASAREEGQRLPVLKSFNYTFPYDDKRGVQRIIDELKDEPFSILRAPTGSGKTDASLLWAKHQIESNRADRLVIAMPTRFTANALSINTAKNLSQVGLYHSSAWFQSINNNIDMPKVEQMYIDKEQELARLLLTPITVTTIDHLCIALTGTREDHHSIFFNLANSCVVIDEADFYDEFTQHNILILLRALKLLQVPVLLMSATVPKSANVFYSKTVGYQIKIHEDKSEIERIRCEIFRYGNLSEPNDIKEILLKGLTGTPLIIYANTVARAQDYYKWFQNHSKEFTENNVVLYHSRFTEPDKLGIEKKLNNMLGKDAWESNKQFGVAILTQIGELSVNISADLMITDICPLDRLVQRVGRLSRFSKTVGELYVVIPVKKNINNEFEFYPAPYGHFTHAGWETTKVLKTTEELLIDDKYSAQKFIQLVDKIYDTQDNNVSSQAINNMKEFQNLVISNWLILPADQIDTDDDHTQEWKCRDIDSQYTIYVNVDLFEGEQYFQNKSMFRQFQIRHGIQCYAYEFHKALEKGYIEKVTFYIGEEQKQSLWIVRKNYYDSKIGLNFNGIED
ncbi:MAG: CRISPR-associated helicase Cas3' [Stygiobacter sp.]